MANYADFKWIVPEDAKSLFSMLKECAELAIEFEGHAIMDLQPLENLKTTACRALFLQKNTLRDNGTLLLADVLHDNTTLSYLLIGGNYIQDGGCVALAEKALRNNSTLKYLNLCDNNIGDTGAKALAEELHCNDSLVEMNLFNNNIGSIGGSALAKALETNVCLNHFDLGRNKLLDEGIVAVGRMLSLNTGLICSNFSFNDFTNDGAKSLLEGLKQNRTLTKITVHGNEFDAEYSNLIKERLKKNEALQKNLFESVLGSVKQRAVTRRCRLSVVGDKRAGKTALIRSLLGKPFVKDYHATDCVKLTLAKTAVVKREWEEVIEKDSNFSFTTKYAAACAMTQVLNPNSPVPNLKRPRIAITDEITPKILQNYDQQLLVNARKEKKSFTLSIWDFPRFFGSVFVSEYVLYFIVVAASSNITDCVQRWKRAVLPTDAKVFIIVTHCTNDVDLQTVQSKVKNGLDNNETNEVAVPGLKVIENDGALFFPVDNSVGDGCEVLRDAVGKNVDHLSEKNFPLYWFKVLDSVLEDDTIQYIDVEKLTELDAMRNISESEGREMLQEFHNMGIVLYDGENVVLRIEWFLEMLSVAMGTREEINLENEKLTLYTTGWTTISLLSQLWSPAHVQLFIHFAQHNALLTSVGKDVYLLPHNAMQQNTIDNTTFTKSVLQIEYRGLGVLGRVVCLILQASETNEKPIINKQNAVIFVGKYRLLVQADEGVGSLVISTENDADDEASKQIHTLATTALEKLKALGGIDYTNVHL